MESNYQCLAKRPALSPASPVSEEGISESVSKYGELASYLVNDIHLQDEGVFRLLARLNGISYTPLKGQPDTRRIITILEDLEPAVVGKGKQFNLELCNALAQQRIVVGDGKRKFTDRFITQGIDTNKQEFRTRQAEASSKAAQGTVMTDDAYQQPYFPCSSYQGPLYFDRTVPVMIFAGGPEDLKTSRYNKESLSDSGRIQRVHAGTSSIAEHLGITVEVPDDALPGRGIVFKQGVPDGLNLDGTLTDEEIISRVCAFWQSVFSGIDSVSNSPGGCKADITLVIDGKVRARHARSNGQMLTDSLSANLMQNLPRLVIATTTEAGSQFINRDARSSIDLVKMICDKNITIYCADEFLVRALGRSTLRIMFEESAKGPVTSSSTASQTLASAAMKVLSTDDIVKIGLALHTTQSMLRQKYLSQ